MYKEIGLQPCPVKCLLFSDTIKSGLFHPRCKDSASPYFEGISTPPDREVLPKKAQEDLTEIERAEQKEQYGRRMEKMYKRLSKYALDPDNKKLYAGRRSQWSEYTEKWHDYHEKLLAKAEKSGIIYKKKPDSIKIDDFDIPRSLSAMGINYDIEDLSTGEIFRFAEGTKIQDAHVFAGKGCKKPLRPEVAQGLSKQIGGLPENWQHAKGNGVIDYYGEHRDAEVHWFQEESVGKHKFRIKRWLDDS